MVTIHFLRTEGREVHTAGPFPWVQATGTILQAGPDGEEIARYRGGIWTVAGYTVPLCLIQGSTSTARFETDMPHDSSAYGPFDQVKFVDGSVYAEPGPRLLARLDEQKGAWYSYTDQQSWPKLVVESS